MVVTVTEPKDSPSPEEIPVGLRERRRQETLREIHDIAVGLFEERGIAATTVDDIALAAGISQRTFFRYFPTKGHAAFAAESDFQELVREAVTRATSGTALVPALQESWLRLFAQIDERPGQHEHAMRLRRLAEGEPALVALLVIEDGKIDEELARGLAEVLGRDPADLAVRAVVVSVNGSARLAYTEWNRLREAGKTVTLSGIYTELLRSVREILG